MKKAGLAAALCVAGCSPAAHAQEPHLHPVPEKLGTVRFATSCAPAVQARFERAVALLHSFAYDASEQAFRAVADSDRQCAMAHWGIAMSYFHQLWQPPEGAELQQGQAEIDTARSLNARSKRERQYIEAAAAYYRDSDHVVHAVRAKAYEQAMAEVAGSNPTDAEARIFHALAMIATAPPADRSHANQKRAIETLETIFRAQPEHPGVAHYLIHACDSAELAARGLSAARAYSKIAPAAPHALHMPSHIFTRLGYWDDSIASNQAARSAARVQGDLGEELHSMDYLTYAFLQRGRVVEATRVVDDLRAMGGGLGAQFKTGYAATAMPVRLVVERHEWAAAASLEPLPQSPPQVAALVYWTRAVAQARTGHPQAADADVVRLEASERQLESAGNLYWATQVEILGKEARAWQAQASGHNDEAIRLLRAAADEEDAVEKLPITPGPVVPAREQLGEILLELDQPREALREYQTSLLAAPGRRGALSGAAAAAERAGDAGAAAHYRTMLGE